MNESESGKFLECIIKIPVIVTFAQCVRTQDKVVNDWLCVKMMACVQSWKKRQLSLSFSEAPGKFANNNNSSRPDNNNHSHNVSQLTSQLQPKVNHISQSQPLVHPVNGRSRSTDSQSRSSMDSLDSVESISSHKSSSGGAPVATPRGKVSNLNHTFSDNRNMWA